MLPAVISSQIHSSSFNVFFNRKQKFIIDYQPSADTLVIKGNFDCEESKHALTDCRHIIEKHLQEHKDIHLFVYFKEYDLANIYAWTNMMDVLEHQSDRIMVNWFMNGTNQSSYSLANEVLHNYRVRAIDVL
jgi:hypothetical protein